ncbi:hypothetical protein NUACC21_57170 [Scytonema sp. NUACC21]
MELSWQVERIAKLDEGIAQSKNRFEDAIVRSNLVFTRNSQQLPLGNLQVGELREKLHSDDRDILG